MAVDLPRLQVLHQVVNEEGEDPLPGQEEVADEVNAIDNDEDGDDDVDVEGTIINVTFWFSLIKATSYKQTLTPSNFVNKRPSSNNRLPSIKCSP